MSENVRVVQVIPNIMSTLSAIKWSCDVVQKHKSVSTSAFSLIGHDSLYSLSATEAVLMVPTLGQKSTKCPADGLSFDPQYKRIAHSVFSDAS
jgi:hypothetical protein